MSFRKNESQQLSLFDSFHSLTEREQIVLTYYFGLTGEDEMTLEEIGKKIGLTKERVRQIKEKSLKKLRAEALKNSISEDIYN